jgi:hypothetical protein
VCSAPRAFIDVKERSDRGQVRQAAALGDTPPARARRPVEQRAIVEGVAGVESQRNSLLRRRITDVGDERLSTASA